MRQYPKPLAKLINELSKLPGVGGKTAQRLAFHILSMTDAEAGNLAHAIEEAKAQMKYCSVCGNLTDTDPCAICSDKSRRQDVICVVESPRDVMAMERIREFDLRPDRADVIVPAASIFLQIARAVHAEDIVVPTMGLSDGIVNALAVKAFE